MRSKTSCFNKTLFRKNLTRFAPAWGLYTLCLILGVLLIYTNGGTVKQYHFGSNMAELIQVMGLVNLFYAPLVAQLLFGDLYNSRMCNAIHAMPVSRDTLFYTNLASGAVFSLGPTLVMMLIAIPLTANSCFHNAWLIPIYAFLGTNLEYFCFFGIAVFSVMCAGNRLSMAVVYGLLNFGAYIAYWLIDTVYTPLLYGVVTPSALAENLTPVVFFVNQPFIETDTRAHLRDLFNNNWDIAVGNFWLTENWYTLILWALAGLVFSLVALVLYRKRDLECAGDAMAFRALEPVFQVLCALVTAAAAQFFVAIFLGFMDQNLYLFLTVGLVVGWFACRMLIERSTRVFRPRNWYGLAGLTAALALTLLCTHWDIFGIETWMPRAENVKSVHIDSMYASGVALTEKEDIKAILRVQEIALEDRLEQSGPYVEGLDGTLVYNIDSNSALVPEQDEINDAVYAADFSILYTMESGKEIRRNYVIWTDSEAGDIAREYLSRWEFINRRYSQLLEPDRLTLVLDSLREIHIDGYGPLPEELCTRETAEALIAALKADAAQRNLAQHYFYHKGCFEVPAQEDTQNIITYSPDIWINLTGGDFGWSISVYPDSENTIRWLQEHDLLTYKILDRNLHYW